MLIVDTNRKGIIITPPDNSGMCFIQAGIMKTKIDVKKLQLIEKQQPQKQTKKPVKKGGVSKNGIESRMTRKVSTELDIRAMPQTKAFTKWSSLFLTLSCQE